jgi:polyvinyl alcohol dehydrogenase (cytochrome)
MQNYCLLFATSLVVFSSALAEDAHRNSSINQRSCGQFNSWKNWGGNIFNSHSNPFEEKLSPASVSNLTTKWTFTTGGDVSATPTVENGFVYFPDWGGNLFKLDTTNGKQIWVHKISEYTGIATSLSRNSPTIVGNLLIFGDQASATLIAVNKESGDIVWKTLIDPLSTAIITSSPVEFDGRIYVGTSSNEETLAASDPKLVLSFRARVACLDAQSGKILWQTFMAPEGYTGCAVWGSSFPIDLKRHSLYVTTGNNYSIPKEAETCVAHASNVVQQLKCLEPDDFVEAVVSLDLYTGKVNWVNRVKGADTWLLSCLFANPTGLPCPDPNSSDFDFGSGANLYTINKDGQNIDYLGAGEKNGIYWALDPDNGRVRWATLVGPGGFLGGIQWGSATDGKRIYVAIANSLNITYRLAPDGKQSANGGSWAALDAATGEMLWQIPETGESPARPGFAAEASGQVTTANGVVYAGSLAGDMLAIEAETGKVLWKFASGASVVCGPSVVNGTLFWGSGYRRGHSIGGNTVYAFALP